MANFNKVILAGNLTRDPEIRVTPKGTSICQFGLAINRSYKDDSGASRDDTTFVDCEAWSKTAETIGKFCTKGKPLLVEGRLKLDSWEDKTSGQKRSKLKVVVENFQFLGGKSDDAAPAEERQPTARSTGGSTAHHGPAGDDKDVPFAAYPDALI